LSNLNCHSLTTLIRSCQYPSSPVVHEAISLGAIVRAVKPDLVSPGELPAIPDHQRAKFPCGHRFYLDCYREQEARFLEWILHRYQGDTWFFTQTFKYELEVRRAEGMRDRFLARLNQAYLELPGAELLRSVSSSEWQQRGVIHFHLLIFGQQLRLLSRKRWEFRWHRRMHGGFCKCMPTVSAHYLAKHQIRNHPDSSMYLGGSWRGINPPRGIERCCSASEGFRDEALAADLVNGVSTLEK